MNLFSKGLLLIAIPCAFELLLLAFLFQGQQDAVRAEQWATHSRDVMRAADGVLITVLEESLRFRGQLLAETPSLASESFWTELDSRMVNLAGMVGDNPVQLAHANTLRQDVRDYRLALQETLKQAQAGGEAAVAHRYRPGGGVVVLDRLRSELSAFLDEEARLDRERTAKVVEARRLQRIRLLLVAAGSLLAAAVGVYAFTRGITGRVATLVENAQRLVRSESLVAPIPGSDEIARLDRVLHETGLRLRESEQLEREYKADLEKRAQELAQVNAALRKQTEDNELFIYSVSHDLRSPLVNLQGFNQELRLAGDEIQEIVQGVSGTNPGFERLRLLITGEVAESLRYMESAVQRAAAIIDALLRLSRAGRIDLQPRWVEPETVIRRVVDALHRSITERGVAVRVHALPVVWVDPLAFEQVFANLIGNAVSYVDPHRPGQVDIGALEKIPSDPATVTFYVKDNGLGIPRAQLGKVFTAFQRLHGTSAPGEGIGLALVRRVVERHGGRVWVESVEREGTTFFVSLPGQPDA
ncbi:MAG: ATP-binding protein [Burkholderiaceae bacterium]